MRRLFWGLCVLLALCAAGAAGLTVYAEEYNYDDSLDLVPEDSFEEFSEEFPEDLPEDITEEFPDSSFGHFVDDPDEENSLSKKVLDMLDSLGSLLDYQTSVSENDIDDSSFDDFSSDDFGGDGVYDILSSMDSSLSTLSDISLYSDFTAFNGAISSTYLDLFRGFLPKLSYKEHYVLYRESQYVYSFVYGEDLSFSGNSFNGSDLTRVYFNAYNTGTFGHSVESSFSLNPGTGVVYSDLGDYYPALSTDTGSQLIQIKWVIFITVLAVWMISLFKGIRRRGDRDKYWASTNTV